jgi:hypothetical protein
MERSPSEAKTELEGWAAHFVRGYLPDLAEHKDRIAEVVVDRLWRVLIGQWYEDLLSERAWHHAALQRLKSDWPEAASRISFALGKPCPCSARVEKWGDEARWLIEEHLGAAAGESADGLEAVYYCPDSGQQWFADHPEHTATEPGSMRIRVVHGPPPWKARAT